VNAFSKAHLAPPADGRGVEQPPTHSTPQINSRRSSPVAHREGVEFDVTPPARPHPRIFTNDFGTFYAVADSHYWAARFAMVGRKNGGR
jgi:hypothetical protein